MTADKEQAAQSAEQSSPGDMCEAEIDYNVMGSFPASDSPSWTLGISPSKKLRRPFKEELISADDPSHQNDSGT